MDNKYHEENYQYEENYLYEDLLKEKQLEEAMETLDGIKTQELQDLSRFLTKFVIEKLVTELNQRLEVDPSFVSLYDEEVVEINEAIKTLGIDAELKGEDQGKDEEVEYDPCNICPKNSLTGNAACDNGILCPYIGHERIGHGKSDHEGSK